MILGVGTDICPVARWTRLIERHGEKGARRILHPEEADHLLQGPSGRLAERLAGRWAIRESFGKALGTGMEGWSWKELRFLDGKLWVEGELLNILRARGITRLHGSVSHDGGIAFATVILEGIDSD